MSNLEIGKVTDITFKTKTLSKFTIRSCAIKNDCISDLYSVELIVEPPIGFDETQMKKCLYQFALGEVHFESKSFQRNFSGVISHMKYYALKSFNTPVQYKMKLKPLLWLLKKKNNFRSWVLKDSREIITSLLSEYQKAYTDFEFEFQIFKSLLLKRKNTIQHGESDFDFFCRLLDEDGLNYTFIQDKKGHKLLISDDLDLYFNNEAPEAKDLQIGFYSSENISDSTEFYDYQKTLAITVDAAQSEFIDSRKFGSHITTLNSPENARSLWRYSTAFDNSGTLMEDSDPILKNFVETQLRKRKSKKEYLKGKSTHQDLLIGSLINLTYHSDGPKKSDLVKLGKYRVTHLNYYFSPPTEFGGRKSIGEKIKLLGCHTELKAYPEEDKYCKSYKSTTSQYPIVTSAIVFGKIGEQPTVEEPMFLQIKFPWHSEEENTETGNSNFVTARLSHMWANNGSGTLFIPEVGDEVLVIMPKPDSIVVIHSLYNSTHPYPLDIFENPEELKSIGLRGKVKQVENEDVVSEIKFWQKGDDEFVTISGQNIILDSPQITFKTKKLNVDVPDSSLVFNKDNLSISMQGKANMSLNSSGECEVKSEKTTVKGTNSIILNKMKIGG